MGLDGRHKCQEEACHVLHPKSASETSARHVDTTPTSDSTAGSENEDASGGRVCGTGIEWSDDSEFIDTQSSHAFHMNTNGPTTLDGNFRPRRLARSGSFATAVISGPVISGRSVVPGVAWRKVALRHRIRSRFHPESSERSTDEESSALQLVFQFLRHATIDRR